MRKNHLHEAMAPSEWLIDLLGGHRELSGEFQELGVAPSYLDHSGEV